MKVGSKADEELEKIERQIAQLELITGPQPEAQKQIRALQEAGDRTAQTGESTG